jgi:hypothetical protein
MPSYTREASVKDALVFGSPPASRRQHTSVDCDYGSLIKHPARFPTWMRAIELGYNGCWYCQSGHNVVAIGQLL